MKAAVQVVAPDSDPDSWDSSDDNEDAEEPLNDHASSEKDGGLANAPERNDSGELGDVEDMRFGGEDEEEDDDSEDDKLETEAASQGKPLGVSTAQADASASDSPDEDEQQGGPPGMPDNKAASFARAFARIMESGGSGRGLLQGSRSLLKRKREVDAEEQVVRDARQLRREMRMRGHVRIPAKGTDPVMDAREKALSRIATRGVVRLFNAVAKAQKQQEEAKEGKSKGAPQLSKAAFLAELQGKLGKPQVSEQMVPSVPSRQKIGLAASGGHQAAAAAAPEGGWDVLQGGLVGSSGSGMRMKDWDKALEESDDEEPGHAQHTDVDSSDDSSGQDD